MKIWNSNRHMPSYLLVNEKFVFIRVPKTGTRSTLERYKSANNKEMISKIKSPCYQHEGIDYISKFISKEQYPDIKYISCCRNPYSHFYSYYHHTGGSRKFPSFESWLEHHLNTNHVGCLKYHTINNKYALDKLFYTEGGLQDLHDYIDQYCKVKTVNHQNKFQGTYNHNKDKIISEFTKKSIDMIQNKYPEEFEFYGYSKNIEDMFQRGKIDG